MAKTKVALPNNWHLFKDAEVLAQNLTNTILEIAQTAIDSKGSFHFITAGGTTPNRCYQLLSNADADWKKWHIYLGDERVLPFVNSDRNSQALLTHWLSNNDIPAKQVHFINTEAGLEKSAKAYAEIIEGMELFDLCLLGMGEDGHTASLFPRHDGSDSVVVYGEQGLIVSESDSPKPPANRVSLNYSAFSKCKTVFKVITGQSKKEAVTAVLEGASLPIDKAQGLDNQYWISQDVL